LCKLLTQHIRNTELSIKILSCLVNCLYKNEKSKITFITEGLFELYNIEIVKERLRTFQYVSRLLRNLCKIEQVFRSRLITDKFIIYLINMSREFLEDTVIQENILWALLNVTLNSRTAKGILNRVGGIAVVANVLNHYERNEVIQRLAVTLFNQISTRTTTRASVAKQYGIPAILDLLYSWEKSQDIQLMCLKTIDVLCTLSLCRRRLAQEGRLKKLIDWLCVNVENRPYISSGLNICQKLSISATESKEALLANGGFPMFATINQNYNEDQEIIAITLKTQQNLSTPADYESESSEEEVLSSGSSGEYEDYDD